METRKKCNIGAGRSVAVSDTSSTDGSEDEIELDDESADSTVDEKLEATALDTLKYCDKDIHPTINTLLWIFGTLPVTNASVLLFAASKHGFEQ
ncbi:hypothetical protein JTB14_007314 [Gonioctena quinquepunctata]|nr:hypothetical protein JTB14_007314 [Gonioctena quinquepunctata]